MRATLSRWAGRLWLTSSTASSPCRRGEEAVLFGRQPDRLASQDFLDAVSDAKRDQHKALRMHDPDRDSDGFVRRRFDDYTTSGPSLASFRGIELTPPQWEEQSVNAPKDEEKEKKK